MSKTYDFLIVGAGLYGASAARILADRGAKVLVAEKRDHIAGNAYTEDIEGVCVHVYGAHIFHTSNRRVWEFVNRFARFNGFVNKPVAACGDSLYPLPFNMNTFRELWGVTAPEEAEQIIRSQAEAAGLVYAGDRPGARVYEDLERYAVSHVGTDVYEKLIKGYTEKQWGRPCSELPASIIRRIPVRFEYNNNYFDDIYQGVPLGGFTEMVGRMLSGIDVLTGTDFFDENNRKRLTELADVTICSGQIDAFYDYCFGPLGYRGLRFETETYDRWPFQQRAVVNYTDSSVPWTRIIEHRHFACDDPSAEKQTSGPVSKTVITREYPAAWRPGDEAFYPINDEENAARYRRYRVLADKEEKVIFGGRLGSYRYLDMDDVIEEALVLTDNIWHKR